MKLLIVKLYLITLLIIPAWLGVNAQTCIDPPSGLVHWWPGDESAIDLVGSNNGTMLQEDSFWEGKVYKAFNFTEGDDYVDCGNVNLSASGTWMAWINTNEINTDQVIMSKSYQEQTIGLWLILRGPSVQFQIYDDDEACGNEWPTVKTSTGSISDGHWYHIAATWGNGGMKIYLNGDEVNSLDCYTCSGQQSNHPFVIGNWKEAVDAMNYRYGFNGLIDEVSIFNRELSNDEIESIYTSGTLGFCRHDIWIKDCEADDGTVPSHETEDGIALNCPGDEWARSPDIYIDNDLDGVIDEPVVNQANRLFAIIRNNSTYPISNVNVDFYYRNNTTGFVFPGNPPAKHIDDYIIDHIPINEQ